MCAASIVTASRWQSTAAMTGVETWMRRMARERGTNCSPRRRAKVNEHKCPVCGQSCDCENYMLYGDCSHDCEEYKRECGLQLYPHSAEPDDYFGREP